MGLGESKWTVSPGLWMTIITIIIMDSENTSIGVSNGAHISSNAIGALCCFSLLGQNRLGVYRKKKKKN